MKAEVYRHEPYSGRGQADTSNATDGIFTEQGKLALKPAGQGFTTQ